MNKISKNDVFGHMSSTLAIDFHIKVATIAIFHNNIKRPNGNTPEDKNGRKRKRGRTHIKVDRVRFKLGFVRPNGNTPEVKMVEKEREE